MILRLVRAGIFLLAGHVIAGLAGLPATAADLAVDLELALAVDVSGSVDEEEAVLQRRIGESIAAFARPRERLSSVVPAHTHPAPC
jgi:hypothetical protein